MSVLVWLAVPLLLIIIIVSIVARFLFLDTRRSFAKIDYEATRLMQIAQIEMQSATTYKDKLKAAGKMQKARKMVGSDFISKKKLVEYEEEDKEMLRRLKVLINE